MKQVSKFNPSSVPYTGPDFDVKTTLINLIRQLNTQANIPTGGTTGQTLKKASNKDYDVIWG